MLFALPPSARAEAEKPELLQRNISPHTPPPSDTNPSKTRRPLPKIGRTERPSDQRPRGMTLGRHGILTTGLSAVTVATLFIPKPSQPKITGGLLFDTPIQTSIQAHDEQSQKTISLATDVGIYSQAALLALPYAFVPAFYPLARNKGYANRARIESCHSIFLLARPYM